MTTVHRLYELQELDWEIDRSQTQLTSVKEQIEDDSELVRIRDEIEEQQNTVRQLHQKQSTQTLELQAIEDRVKALDSRLYGGAVKSPREMESGFSEIQIAKEQAQQAEDQLLAMMVELEEAEKRMARSSEELVRMDEERGKSLVTLGEERTTLLKQLEGLTKDRGEKVSHADPEHLVRYEKVRQARQGYAVARVERGMCQGCRLTLPTHEMQRLRSGSEPIQCNSCARILYLS
ncbi:MAG: C4-type zinc ribbon domain-containing protein [Chloroflexi bacterium]|nr:C4-type zinc ribbon domain-containing protein [Chloroflexota bacterium]